MRAVFAAAALCLALTAAAAAQEPTPAPGARMVDGFGDIMMSDWLARLDFFAIELQQEPDSRGYIVAHAARGKFIGWPLRRASAARDYLTETRALDPARVSVVNGGVGQEVKYELWVVSPGATLPVKPLDLSLLMSGERTPQPFDRFAVYERGDREMRMAEDGEDYLFDNAALYAPFVEALRADPGLRGCVIVYVPRGGRRGSRRLAGRVKLAISKAHAVDVRRLSALGGGRRRHKLVELWLVPPGSPLPKPSRTVPRDPYAWYD